MLHGRKGRLFIIQTEKIMLCVDELVCASVGKS